MAAMMMMTCMWEVLTRQETSLKRKVRRRLVRIDVWRRLWILFLFQLHMGASTHAISLGWWALVDVQGANDRKELRAVALADAGRGKAVTSAAAAKPKAAPRKRAAPKAKGGVKKAGAKPRAKAKKK
jgi:hypothetical protein